MDLWQLSHDGICSFFSAKVPEEYLLRGRLRTDTARDFDVRTVPYQIPGEGPLGDLRVGAARAGRAALYGTVR